MRKKILTVVMAAALTLTSVMPVFATPNQEVIENQQKYEEINKKIDDIQAKIYGLNEQISPLAEKVENNKKQMEDIKEQIENTNKEIETSKADISDKEEVLGKRLRELYKTGGQGSYLTLIFSADNFSDLISKVDSASRLVNIDKKIVKDLVGKKEKLDEKVASLEEKSQEVAQITEETNKALGELEVKKKEQEVLIADAQTEKTKFDEEFLSVSERNLVSPQLQVLESSSSSTEVENAISQLISIKDNQLKSPTVIEELNNSIATAQARVEELKAQEQAAKEAEAREAAAREAAAKAESEAHFNRGSSGVAASASSSSSSSASSSSSSSGSAASSGSSAGTVSASGSGSDIVNFAYGYLGTPYVFGATGPSSFDCSGFTSFVYRNVTGIDITRTTYSQIGVGTPVAYGDLRPGDLVFTYGNEHVGIYVGGGQYIHAPQPGDKVKVSPVTSFYAARRVLN